MPGTPRSDLHGHPLGGLGPIDEPEEGGCDDTTAATIGPEVLEVQTAQGMEADISLTPRNQLVASDVAWMASLMQTLSASLQDGGRWMQGFELD